MKNIYLVGFMGTGKTSVANMLSRIINEEIVDLDSFIEAEEKCSINEIFHNKGEAYFRKLEQGVLKEFSCKTGIIVSCGGGIVLNTENIKIMQDSGFPVCLKASSEVIYERLKDKTDRPLLRSTDPKKAIEELLAARKEFYDKIPFSIDTSKLTISEVANRIINEFGLG